MTTNRNPGIPIVVGVTGHREIRPRDRAAIETAVRTELEKLKAQCPHSTLLMLNSLAEGGDLLCADAAEALDIPLTAVLPRDREDYLRDFSEEGKARFARHCARADAVFTAPPTETLPDGGPTREYQFRQADIYVAAHCHVLLALWDGAPGKAAGCGTAETVDFALHGSYTPVMGIPLRSEANTAVIHILTPRESQPEGEAGTTRVLGRWDSVAEILRRTDDFNRSAQTTRPHRSTLPLERGTDPVLDRLESVSRAAGDLSRKSANRYRLVLALLAVSSALLTFAFLLYDEVQAIGLILVCGAMLLAAGACLRYAAHSECHRRYIEYRMLAESLRVQAYLRFAGSRVQAAELLSWTQQDETAWVPDALCALSIGSLPEESHDILGPWVDAQRDYHSEAAGRADRNLTVSERAVQFSLIVSVLLYLGAVGYELLCGGLLLKPAVAVADVELWRTVLKLVLGSISAVTLFISNYYGKLSLHRVFSDHEKMERFYCMMGERLRRNGQTEEMLTVLAREELIENGNWTSYQRDNKPDIDL